MFKPLGNEFARARAKVGSVGILSFAEVARRLGVDQWKVAKLFDRGLLPTPSKIGNLRVVSVEDLPRVKQALEQAGYLAKSA